MFRFRPIVAGTGLALVAALLSGCGKQPVYGEYEYWDPKTPEIHPRLTIRRDGSYRLCSPDCSDGRYKIDVDGDYAWFGQPMNSFRWTRQHGRDSPDSASLAPPDLEYGLFGDPRFGFVVDSNATMGYFSRIRDGK